MEVRSISKLLVDQGGLLPVRAMECQLFMRPALMAIIIIMILNTPLKVQYVYVWGFGERMIKSYAVAIVYNICSVSDLRLSTSNLRPPAERNPRRTFAQTLSLSE